MCLVFSLQWYSNVLECNMNHTFIIFVWLSRKTKKSHRNRQMINSHTNCPFNFVPATLCPELSIIYSLTYLLKSIPIYRFTSGSNVFSYSFLIMCACFLCIISSSWISPKSPIKIDGILMVPRYDGAQNHQY